MKPLVALLALAITGLALASPNRGQSLRGIPFYQIYEKKDIDNSSRSNFITTAPDGRLFFGCENGLHVYDGTDWKNVLPTLSTHDKIRALAWTEHGVFAAGYGKIGRLDFEDKTGIVFEPLNPRPLTPYTSEFYSKIYQQGKLIYFIGERSVAILDVETMKHEATTFDSWVKGSALFDGKLLVATSRDGIVVFDGVSHQKHPSFERFTEKHVILKIERSESGETYFSTEANEIFRIPAGQALEQFVPFPFKAQGAIRDLEFIDENKLAISVARSGIYFVNREGQTLSFLRKDHDYRWSGSNALHLDKNGTLWVQFHSTVGKVIVNSPITQIDERLSMGVDYPIAHEVEGQLYITTNGRLLSPFQNEYGGLQGFVDSTPNLDRSISTAIETEDGLYFQGGKSTFVFEDNGNPQKLGDTGFIERLVPVMGDERRRFFASTANSLILMHREGDTMVQDDKISHDAGHINKIARAPNHVFWLEIGIGQLGRAKIEDGSLRYELFTHQDGLPNDWIAVWEHEGEVLFTTSRGIYRYNEKSATFENTDILEAYLPASGVFHRVATDPYGNVWASYETSNYILWKQADGSYLKDAASLSQLDDQFFNQFKFLSNGDTLLLTATNIYHVSGNQLRVPRETLKQSLFLFEVSDIEGTSHYYLNSGIGAPPQRLSFASDRRNLSVRAGATYSSSTKPPLYQFFLEGMSEDWTKWSTANKVNFTKLDAREYTLRIRSRPHESIPPEEIAIALSIEPTVFETPLAYALYVLAFAVSLYFGYSYFVKNLKKTNLKLETMVRERTREIESKNRELQKNANELSYTVQELRSAQDLLISASRKAGMAEVATNVLHNVGNVLNSINVALLSLTERLSQERVNKLVRVSQLVNEHQHDLADFLTNDPKGKSIPAYLTQLSRVLSEDDSHYRIEVECMQENIEHVKKIITTQQSHAKTVEVLQTVKIEELFNDALEITTGDIEYSLFEVVRDFEPNLEIESDKHSLLQMVTNFIKNAKESIIESGKPLGVISLTAKTEPDGQNVRIQISDNGVGISKENERKIFTHGFTTKSDGHGFGMHSCANAAKNLGGSLEISSEGLGKGATVTLIVPINARAAQRAEARNTLKPSSSTSFSRN